MSVNNIYPEEFAELCRLGKSIDVVDVRTPAEFAEVHLSMARNIPLDQLDPAALMGGGDEVDERPLFVVCQAGGRGQRACEKLQRAGYANVFNIAGGTQACVAAGLPVVRGKKAISLERQVRIAAGALVLVGIGLSFLHPALLSISIFVGAGLVFSGVTDTCGMALLLALAPWNRHGGGERVSCSTGKRAMEART